MRSPWGGVDWKRQLEEGVWWVSTPGHGGLMVRAKVAEAKLSDAARKCGSPYEGGAWFCYEEDCDYAVAFLEQPEWSRVLSRACEDGAGAVKTDAQIREEMEAIVRRWTPEYFGLPSLEQQREEREAYALAHGLHPIKAALGCKDGSIFVWAGLRGFPSTEVRAYLKPDAYKMPSLPPEPPTDRQHLEDYERAGEVLRLTDETYPASERKGA